MWGQGPVEEIRSVSKDQLLEAIQRKRFRTPRCLNAFIDRCQEEVVKSPKGAVVLCLHAPDYVDRVLPNGSKGHADSLIRTLGTLGTCFSESGQNRLAEMTFKYAGEVEPADALERATLDARYAYHLARSDWRKGFELADTVVEAFRTDRGKVREDRSLALALTHRAVIQGYGYSMGDEAADPEQACQDFREALTFADNLPRNQLAAVTGIGAMTVIMWWGGRPVRHATPSSVIRDITNARKALRRQRIPQKSPVDCRCRWLLGLAAFMQAGGLSERATRFLHEARSDLVEVGTAIDVVEITLDYQWCLIQDGNFADAFHECRYLADRIEFLPQDCQFSMHLWQENLKKGLVRDSVAREIYRKVRGVPSLAIPSDAPISGESTWPVCRRTWGTTKRPTDPDNFGW